MELKTEKITLTSTNKQKVKEIYHAAFPKEDRMPFVLMLLMACLRSTRFLSFHDGDTLCGFIYMASIRKISFVMFFAVDEVLRSNGYGSRILEKIQSLYPNNKMIVTIEKCDEDAEDLDERIRRKKFYSNNGYEPSGYFVKLGNQEQEILIKNGAFDKREFFFFFLRYSNFTVFPKISKIP